MRPSCWPMFVDTAVRIFARIILPVFVLIGVGVVMDRTLHVDLATLARLCFRVLLPALIVVKLLEADLELGPLRTLLVASLLHLAAMLAIGSAVFARARSRPRRVVLGMGAALANCGNFGIPLAELAFPEHGTSVMAILLLVQNLLTFSVGILLIERFGGGSRSQPGRALATIIRMPVLHAIALGLLLRSSGLILPDQLSWPLHHVAAALVPLALITLGVQLARSPLAAGLGALSGMALVRLLISPLVALGVVRLLGVPAPYAPIFVVAGGLPVAVNVYILAAEYELDSTLASQSILWTTLLSAGTLSLLLALLG